MPTPLRNRIQEMLDYIAAKEEYIDHNGKLLDIHQGNLKKYVQEDLVECLSPEYYSKIKTRLVIVNVLKRFIDKVSKVYALTPVRTVTEESTASDQDLVDEYEDKFDMNVRMNDADEYSNLHKGFLLEPFLTSDMEPEQKLRVYPFDKFLVKSDTPEDPLKVDLLIKFMGKRSIYVTDRRKASGIREERREVYYAYTDKEFLAFDSEGDIFQPAMEKNTEGINPFGVIPAYYGFRSSISLLPVQDTDILAMTRIIPVLLSDLSGAILFSCFSIMYGVDVDTENLLMSPNAFWSFQSDPKSDKTPQVGVVKPQADIDKVLNYIMQVFVFWLETKGVKVGSVGNMDASNVASGIAKVIDEMDTTEIKKLSIKAFQRDEEKFWQVLKVVHNTWIDQGLLTNTKKFSDNFALKVEFDEPEVIVDREKKVRTTLMEVNAGFLYPEKAIRQLYPNAEEEEIEKHLAFYGEGPDLSAPDEDDED